MSAKRPSRVSKSPAKKRTGQAVMMALSVRQPFAEMILRGTKKIEYRSIPTHKRERVYVYASKVPRDDAKSWASVGREPGELPTGVLVGTVEIVDCRMGRQGIYEWKLARPQRLHRPIKPKRMAQPVFFRPL